MNNNTRFALVKKFKGVLSGLNLLGSNTMGANYLHSK